MLRHTGLVATPCLQYSRLTVHFGFAYGLADILTLKIDHFYCLLLFCLESPWYIYSDGKCLIVYTSVDLELNSDGWLVRCVHVTGRVYGALFYLKRLP